MQQDKTPIPDVDEFDRDADREASKDLPLPPDVEDREPVEEPEPRPPAVEDPRDPPMQIV